MTGIAVLKWCLDHKAFILSIILSLLLASASAYYMHKHDVEVFTKKQAEAVAFQKSADEFKCDKDKQLTAEVSHDYQTKIADLTSRVSALKRLQRPACVSVKPIAGKADGPDAAPSNAGRIEPDGLAASWLLDYAGRCESYRLQIIGLQDFINRVWDTQK